MKTIRTALLSLPFVIFSGCSGQTAKIHDFKQSIVDTLNNPKITVNVNKRYDDRGNLIRFDSTYSYFYSSPGGSKHLSNDSVYKHFERYFGKNYPDFFNRKQDEIFFSDTLFKYDFYNNDYFRKRFELNQKLFDQLFRQMDSLKNEFLKQHYPHGYQKKALNSGGR